MVDASIQSKIRDPELRDFAMSDERSARTILVEVAVEEPMVRVRGKGRGSRRFVHSPDQENVEKVLEAAREEIRKITSRDVRILRSAHLVVAKATPKQIREILKLATTKCIHSNTEYKAR